jgi:hypothetical protein
LPINQGKSIGTEERYQKAYNLNKIWSKCWGSYVTGDRKKTIEKGYVFRAILKKVFFERGCFDPSYGYADDLTFYFKYGMRSDLADKAICYHRNPETLKEVYRQALWISGSYDNFLTKSIIKYILPFILILVSPVAIIALSIRKCYKNESFKYFFPFMLIFLSARYFGMIAGIFRKAYLGLNTR